MTKPNTKRLILIRHGHRDTQSYYDDNGLSEKGIAQLQKLAKVFTTGIEITEKTKFLSSPKKRCIESIQIVSEAFSKKFIVDQALIERQSDEDSKTFKTRITSWLETWKEQESSLDFVCSHGDWIPQFVKISMDLSVDIQKAGWLDLQYTPESNAWVLSDMSS